MPLSFVIVGLARFPARAAGTSALLDRIGIAADWGLHWSSGPLPHRDQHLSGPVGQGDGGAADDLLGYLTSISALPKPGGRKR